MKKIGIVGGLGPEATVDYYRLIIKFYREKVADGSFPEIIINSIDLNCMINLIQKDDKTPLIGYLSKAVKALAEGGADIALLASNTPHLVFDELAAVSEIPLVSIVEETCNEAKHLGIKKAGLIGTAFTMNNNFYQKIFGKENMAIVTPGEESKKFINSKIFSELVSGIISSDTQRRFSDIINRMKSDGGIDGLILGCTELPLLLSDNEFFGIPFLNTTELHARSIVNRILQD